MPKYKEEPALHVYQCIWISRQVWQFSIFESFCLFHHELSYDRWHAQIQSIGSSFLRAWFNPDGEVACI